MRVKTDRPLNWKKAGFGVLKTGLTSLYHEIKQDDSSFVKNVTSSVNSYQIQDKELGIEGTIRDVARRCGLESQLDKYMQENVIGGIKGRLAYALDLTTAIKDSLEDVLSGAELAATAAAAIPTAGAGAVLIQIGDKVIKVPLYIATQTAYTAVAGLLGYASGTYALTKKGTMNYASDTAKGYIGAIGSNVPVLGNLLELGTNLDDKRPRIAEAAARRTQIWLVNKIREKEGLPTLEPEPLLEDIVRAGFQKAKDKIKRPKPKLVEYEHKPVYGADFGHQAYPALAA